MGIAGITVKVMPTSPSVDMEELKKSVTEIVEKNEGQILEFTEEPVAFGLKALMTRFKWDEEKESDNIVEEFNQIEDVNSSQITDIRRLVQ